MIKMFGWESRTSQIIKDKREEELYWLWKSKVTPHLLIYGYNNQCWFRFYLY